MNRNSKLYFIHCLTPVHVGTGQGVGIIDMPIRRERVTGWPMIPGSSVKGVKREYFGQLLGANSDWLAAAFGRGKDTQDDGLDNEDTRDDVLTHEGNAGALVMSDGRLLAFPVASRKGTFAYVSCPMAIRRLLRDASAADLSVGDPGCDRLEAMLGREIDAVIGSVDASAVTENRLIYIDEFECRAGEDREFGRWVDMLAGMIFKSDLSKDMFIERFVLVSDEAFQYFVTMCCEVSPRIRIEQDRKTVENGALWYEEYLPPESILYGIVWCDKIHVPGSKLSERDLLDKLNGELQLQIGGNASVGKGRVCCSFAEGGEE